jgi:ring-1,2-phenylacetyl-CoA epoxidase subunit PaaD
MTTDTLYMEAEIANIYSILKEVNDPEVPVLNVLDLGIIRDVKFSDDKIEIIITPTYSGCPAMDAISMDIRMKLLEHKYNNIKITSVLSPAWTTEWMSEEGKRKLKEYGIAPPGRIAEGEQPVSCPQCNSADTRLISQFGSTACKSLYQCNNCLEFFDHFKCH